MLVARWYLLRISQYEGFFRFFGEYSRRVDPFLVFRCCSISIGGRDGKLSRVGGSEALETVVLVGHRNADSTITITRTDGKH